MSITWQDIDLETGYINITRTKNRNQATIPIHPELDQQLQTRVPQDKTAPVIPFNNKDSLTTGFRRALQRAGLSHKKNPVHILRHTLGYLIISADLSETGERIAQEMLRHTTPSMTKIYTMLPKEKLKTKIATLQIKE